MTDPTGRSLGEMIRDIGGNIDRIVRTELHLAVAEVRQRLESFSEVSVQLAAGILAAIVAVVFALLGGMFALATVLPLWGAALLVALLPGAIAAILLFRCRAHFANRPAPTPRLLVPGPKEIA